MLSEVHAADPPDGLRSFEISKAIIDKEAFGGVLHPRLLHSLNSSRQTFHELTGGGRVDSEGQKNTKKKRKRT
jgi:hypothetical protein